MFVSIYHRITFAVLGFGMFDIITKTINLYIYSYLKYCIGIFCCLLHICIDVVKCILLIILNYKYDKRVDN